MNDLDKRVLDLSSNDEFGNLALLFDGQKIKVHVKDNEEPMLMVNDLMRCCRGRKSNLNMSKDTPLLMKPYAAHNQIVEAKYVAIVPAARYLTNSRSKQGRKLLEFLESVIGFNVPKKKSAFKTARQKPPRSDMPQNKNVEFKRIPGASAYCAGNNGSIWGCRSGEWIELKQGLDKDGYRTVAIKSDIKAIGNFRFQYKITVHRLILLAFKGQPSLNMMACHNNGNQIDNRPDNLRWGTAKDNAQDMIKHRIERQNVIGLSL